MKKNYYFKEAYSGNSHFMTYVNGVLEKDYIINDYGLDAYISHYVNKGYTFGFPPEEVEKCKHEYERAKKNYEYAKSNAI